MEFKWEQAAPFRSYGTQARRARISVKLARGYGLALELKGFLRREIRTGNTNLFDLTPLFDNLLQQISRTAVDNRETPTSR